MQRGNRESTIKRKLKFLKVLHGTPEEMVSQILNGTWVDKSERNALDTVYQYAEFLNTALSLPL